jgi:hypothetical protein
LVAKLAENMVRRERERRERKGGRRKEGEERRGKGGGRREEGGLCSVVGSKALVKRGRRK